VRHQSPHEIIVVIDGNTALFERARREIAGVRVLVPDEFNWIVGCTYAGMPQNDGRVRNLIGGPRTTTGCGTLLVSICGLAPRC
jgi:hypothetical protein